MLPPPNKSQGRAERGAAADEAARRLEGDLAGGGIRERPAQQRDQALLEELRVLELRADRAHERFRNLEASALFCSHALSSWLPSPNFSVG